MKIHFSSVLNMPNKSQNPNFKGVYGYLNDQFYSYPNIYREEDYHPFKNEPKEHINKATESIVSAEITRNGEINNTRAFKTKCDLSFTGKEFNHFLKEMKDFIKLKGRNIKLSDESTRIYTELSGLSCLDRKKIKYTSVYSGELHVNEMNLPCCKGEDGCIKYTPTHEELLEHWNKS